MPSRICRRQRDTREQAVDLRLALCWALRLPGDLERVPAYLREAEALATALDDPRRLAQVSALSVKPFPPARARYDQAITAAQRALALATAGGDVAQQAQANHFLGLAYHAQGDYRRAIDCCSRPSWPSVGRGAASASARSSCSPCSPVPSWPCAMPSSAYSPRAGPSGKKGSGLPRRLTHPGSLMWACWGIALLALRQGDLSRALPLLERAMGICQDADLQLFFPCWLRPWVQRTPWPGASLTLCRYSRRRWNRPWQRKGYAIRRSVVSPWGRRSGSLAIWRRRTPSPSTR